ncbi:MAG: Transamidase GatB domain protein [uncultured Thiotrichaceae bacterium]|uniref:Transamidase GatB domain protein n=1 Tax=uncultured Thiotrichaceae bacterium TaxID=298394 RepID=A0A6S6UBZ0_9GAMM|nr:MAG: Transamidase GatB domain protein [uncultured Thiotrichaceae bacterium]
MTAALKNRITDDMKSAMRAKDKNRLQTIRLILAAIKQQEVDTREEVSEDGVLLILDKLVKQRRDSIKQFNDAGREDLSSIEEAELLIIQEYLPTPLTEDEITTLIDEAIQQSGASGMKEMGKVMGIIKPKAQGRADMGKISGLIKSKLS